MSLNRYYASCRFCGSKNIESCLSLDRFPKNISKLLKIEDIQNDKPISLKIYKCYTCSLVQLTKIPPKAFYDEHISTAMHSPQMNKFQNEQAKEFIKRFRLQGKRVIDIGCGEGNYMAYLSDAGALTYGIEPSAITRKIARQRGLTVFSGYVCSKNPIPKSPYDAFVCRQVLEHIPDLTEFLLRIRASIKENAPGLFEVPSLEQILKKKRFYDFCSDHVNYFTFSTLYNVLMKCGFEIVEMRRVMNEEYNLAIVRASSIPKWDELKMSVNEILDEIKKIIIKAHIDGKSVGVWGAGVKGLSILASLKNTRITYVVDSDPYKQGLCTPVSHLPIVSPKMLYSNPVDIIIVTSITFQDEVLRQLVNKYKFRGVIYLLGPKIIKIDSKTKIREDL